MPGPCRFVSDYTYSPIANSQGDAGGMIDTLKLIISLAWRNLWRNKRRTLLTMIAIVIAVMSMVTFGAFMRAWSNTSLLETINNLTGHGQIHHAGYLDDPNVDYRIQNLPSALVKLLEQPPITHYAKRVRVPAMLVTERENSPIEIIGIQPQSEIGLSFISGAVTQGRYLNSDTDHGILLGEKLVSRLQTKLGRRLVVMSQGADGAIEERGMRIVGIFKSQPQLEKSIAFMAFNTAQSMLKIGSDYSEIVFRVEDKSKLDRIIPMIKRQAGALDVHAWDEIEPFTKAMVEMSEGSILIWILVSFTVVSFGLVNSLLMAVYERLREFGLLQALGMKPRWLLVQVLLESVFIVVLATLIGLVTGILIVMGFQDGINLGIGASYFGGAQIVYPELDWEEISTIGLVVLFLGLLASLYPAIRASRQVPVDILSRATT
jgi:ABC-type lipoprotein release transport system permease subunit